MNTQDAFAQTTINFSDLQPMLNALRGVDPNQKRVMFATLIAAPVLTRTTDHTKELLAEFKNAYDTASIRKSNAA